MNTNQTKVPVNFKKSPGFNAKLPQRPSRTTRKAPMTSPQVGVSAKAYIGPMLYPHKRERALEQLFAKADY